MVPTRNWLSQDTFIQLVWLLGLCITTIMAGCDKLTLKNTLYHEYMEGTYVRLPSLCLGHNIYRQSNGDNYMFYMIISDGWHGWMIGRRSCSTSASIAVETEIYYPEEVNETWKETFDDAWYYNTILEVECYHVSSTTIVGILIAILVLISLAAFLSMKYRQMKLRRRMLPQSVRRTQVSTVATNPSSGRMGGPTSYQSNAHQQPRYGGPGRSPGVRYPPAPSMRPGYGHGPMIMMTPGYGHGPMVSPYKSRPVAPPPYSGISAPLAPAYPGVGGPPMSAFPGPPPPYRPIANEYPDNHQVYPSSDIPVTDQPPYQLTFQQEQQLAQRQLSQENDKDVQSDEKTEPQTPRSSIQTVTHGRFDSVNTDTTPNIAD